MPALRIVFALLLATGILHEASPLQDPVDPALRSAVERFFATQEAEDVEGYLALWSTKASRPRPEILKYIFDGGDDRFSDIQVIRVMAAGERVRVRVSALRDRTQPSRTEGRLERSIADASARRSSQQQRLFDRLPDLRIWRGLLAPATRSDAEGALDAGTILVQFVVDDDDLLILWARRGGSGVEHSAHVRAMTRKSLAELVAKLTPQDVLKDETAWRKAALELRDVLPESLRSSLAGSLDAIVVAHEVLWRVPFEALPFNEGYLADKVRVRYAPGSRGSPLAGA